MVPPSRPQRNAQSPNPKEQVLELVDRLRGESGLVVISTMHDLTIAGDHADQLLLLADGRTVITGPADEVLRESVLAEVYGTPVEIVEHEGRRIVLPRREDRW